MTALYTDAATVAAEMRLAPDTSLASAAAQGATSLSLAGDKTADGTALYPGMSLALDQYLSGSREVVTITGAATGTGPFTVPVSALVNAHVQGAPVREVSRLLDVIDPASRAVDEYTHTEPGAWAQQSWAEQLFGKMMPTEDGRLYVSVTGRNVTAVSSFQWQQLGDNAWVAVEAANLAFDDYVIWAMPPAALPAGAWLKNLLVQVTYMAGYATLPGAISRAAAIMAARLYKEADAGFSDVTGSAQTGIMEYRNRVPRHVEILLDPRKRVA